MSGYAEALQRHNPRLEKLFNVETEALQSGSMLVDDPFPALNALREAGPVHRGSLASLLGHSQEEESAFRLHIPGHLTYSVMSFSGVYRAFLENEIFSSRVYQLFERSRARGVTMIEKVGADHRAIRGAMQSYFGPDAAQGWWVDKIIRETVEVLVAELEGKGKADLFLEVCARMPVHVVSAAFGFDAEDIIPFRVALLESGSHDASADERKEAQDTTARMLGRLIEQRRRDPRDDIMSNLVHASVTEADGTVRALTDDEIISNCRLIVLAGGGTTWRQLGITLHALLNHPDQLQLAVNNRSLIPRVIAEAARLHPTDLMFPRIAEQDALLEGVEIPKGALVHLCLGSANRDPSRWENPDAFDISRPLKQSVAFGGGPHSCLGQHVSRQEMVMALNAIFDRLPHLRWNPDAPPSRLVGSLFQRGPTALPVLFD